MRPRATLRKLRLGLWATGLLLLAVLLGRRGRSTPSSVSGPRPELRTGAGERDIEARPLDFETVDLAAPREVAMPRRSSRPSRSARLALVIALGVSLATLIAVPGALYLTSDPVDAGELPALGEQAAPAAAAPTIPLDAARLASRPSQLGAKPDRGRSQPDADGPLAGSYPGLWTPALEHLGHRDAAPTPAVSPIFEGTPLRSALGRDALKGIKRAIPVSLSIPAINLEARVDSAGVERRTRELAVPNSAETVVWYEHGPTPGEAGSAVLAAHVDFNGVAGAFFRLRDLRPGERIAVALSDGTTSRFEVVAKRKYDRDRLPNARIFTSSGPPVLTLITCGGRFDDDRGRYASNVVVFAVPLGSA